MKLRNKKTGEIADLSDGSINTNIDGGSIIFFSSMRHGKYQEFKYTSLSELNEEWEDYEPKEPLIKDEKARKAVRAWLEANDLDGATYYTSSHHWYLRAFNDREQGIDFWLNWENKPNLIENKYYTKTELCGEEEE